MRGRPGSAARARAFTLIESCLLLALAGILATLAWPSYREALWRSQRADAVAALTRLMLAQEGYRAHHGAYAAQLPVLRGASPTSAAGLYRIELRADGGDAYEASATVQPGSAVAADAACAVLRLSVRDGVGEHAPSARCWNR